MGVLLGLCAAFSFGIADLLGGLASRRVPSLWVACWNQLVAIPIFAVLLFVFPAPNLRAVDMVNGGLSAIALLGGLLLLYRVLREGAMGVLIAITGIVSSLVPFLWALGQGERLTWIGGMGVAFALASIVTVMKGPESASDVLAHRMRVIYAVLSGVCFGMVWLVTAAVGHASGVAPLLVMRTVGFVLALGLVLRARRWSFERQPLLQASYAGILGVLATTMFLIGARTHTVSTVSVLMAMGPVVTTVVAFVVLGQRLTKLQVTGMALAVVAGILLAV